jgi:hypothetical protein
MPYGKSGITTIIRAIFAWLFDLFKKKTSTPLTLSHPEELPDYSKTMNNTTTEGLLEAWFKGWKVSQQYQAWWLKEMNIVISLQYSYPACTFSETRQLWIRPEWTNSGVVAHELAHVSYSLLTEEMKTNFSAVYTPLKNTDPLIRLLFSQNTYGLTNDVEGHAEVYRYLGEKMPEQLKQFFPKMF